jgi:hypothetical protein
MIAELKRRQDGSWRRWGPYLSERAWGTVREDYSADGDAWSSFPHDHARSRAYRWSEDGLGGICDERQLLCLAFAFWNGHDPILKERVFGLTGHEGNHGEDAKEYWWYLDSTPTHSWMRWRYVYPQAPFPYADLLAENARRDRHAMEYELLDTGVFDGDRYWDVTVDYAKAAPDDICVRVHVRNAGTERATLHLLPTLWFRNRWSWDPEVARPRIHEQSGALVAEDPALGTMTLTASKAPEPLFCDNDTNSQRLWNQPGPVHPKDGINDHVVHGLATVNPQRTGTKAALWYRLEVAPGATTEVRLRLAPKPRKLGKCGPQPWMLARARPTPSTRRWRRGRRRRRPSSCARRSPGCCGASSSTTTTSSAGWMAIPASHRRPIRVAVRRRATAPGATYTTTTSSRCPTSGNTPGTPPGTSRSTA